MTTFTLPDLGEGLDEAEIVSWHVSEGEHVIADQPLVSVETDKAVVEVPAPYSGLVEKIIAREGSIVPIGAPLVEIADRAKTDKGAIVGDLETPEADKDDKTPTAKPKQERPRAAAVASGITASPAVRQLAREKKVDLAKVTGSGPSGAILSRDVLAAQSASAPGTDLRGVRRAMARAMTQARDTVTPATVTDRADIDQWPEDEDPTVRLVQAIAAASQTEPSLNAWFDGEKRQVHDHLDLAIAIDTPDGLFAPVIRGVETGKDCSVAIATLKADVEARTIAPEDLRGATFTLSNFGMLGGVYAAMVVTPPQVAILGAGRIHHACLAQDLQPVVRKVMPLSLTFDHRAVTGGEAARFLAAIRDHLEQPTHV